MKYIKGDITTAKGIIAHGVNRQRVMGAGVARAIVNKWPEVKQAYLNNSPVPPLGSILPVKVSEDAIVVNCYTQEFYGKNGIFADSDAIRLSLRRIKNKFFKEVPGVINIPKIGAGLGGLNWERDVVPQLEIIEDDGMVRFHIWEL